MNIWQAPALGQRTLVAMSCDKCRKLLPGHRFDRHVRKASDPRRYIDRRCVDCRWGAKRK